ncbi:VOC family protein [Nocardia cyriacigeorgica]|uniref:VOC family protein n=1 Tax=Nocardia cyriacigeorgica TaxID=135487 RepID=A0A6P1DBM4_9NOCA|nr:VOC family protein [Nocardia cyriacigeorgica]NEW41954.1 VOC family protein [Nocardia cyriacigeorgica]NEW46971.1 VOC family protein [Nocardia cyriacigeorgica]NEW53016.1 VOC family protein [Nocardia cyriacigeorgica]NEW57088.1 VOC family protein [Nocardia cyriacigeorgica]
MPTRDDAWPEGTPCWVDSQVDDMARARRFYADLFGWEITDMPQEAGGYLIALRNGRPAAGIGPKPAGMPMPSVWTTYIAADDADAVAARVGAAGGTVVMPPFDVLDVGRMFIASDPTGGVFGVWQAKAHRGAGVYNEHGAYCWNELHTGDYRRAQEFYASVFDWNYTEIGDGENFVYSTFASDGNDRPLGGINDVTKMPGDNSSYWLAWFQVDNADTALTRATELGATVISGPGDSPFGRQGVVRGPQGETFAIIDPTSTVGEPPTGQSG